MKIERQILLPDSICNLVKGQDLSVLINNHFRTVTIQRKLWSPEVENYISFKLDFDLHKKLTEEALKRKIPSDILIKNILYKVYKKRR